MNVAYNLTIANTASYRPDTMILPQVGRVTYQTDTLYRMDKNLLRYCALRPL